MGECIGIIGLGRMGSAFARRCLSLGLKVVAWNRTPEKIEKLQGVEPAATPREVAERCGAVHVFVADDEASRAVLRGPEGVFAALRSELIVANHTTVTPSHSLEMYRAAEELGAMYLDAPVVGGPAQTRLGQLLVLVSGTREAYEKALPMLKNLGETVMYVGDVPTATVLKLAINSMFFISAQTISEAMALASAWGVDPEVLREAASKTWLKTLFDKYYDRMMSKERPPSFTVRLAAKDLAYAQQAGYMRGTPLPLVSTALQTYLEASRRGYDSSDYSRIAWHVMGGEPGRSS